MRIATEQQAGIRGGQMVKELTESQAEVVNAVIATESPTKQITPDDGRPHITEDAKAIGLTDGAKPASLSSHEKDAIKQALLDAAKQGPLNGSTANMLIKQFQQVDAA